MATPGFTWRVHPSGMQADVRRARANLLGSVVREMSGVGDAGVAFARSSHPWTNRTGGAESTFTSTTTAGDNAVTITVTHGVFYGIYLEHKNGGRYAVIPSTLNHMAPLVQSGLDRAIMSALPGW